MIAKIIIIIKSTYTQILERTAMWLLNPLEIAAKCLSNHPLFFYERSKQSLPIRRRWLRMERLNDNRTNLSCIISYSFKWFSPHFFSLNSSRCRRCLKSSDIDGSHVILQIYGTVIKIKQSLTIIDLIPNIKAIFSQVS